MRAGNAAMDRRAYPDAVGSYSEGLEVCDAEARSAADGGRKRPSATAAATDTATGACVFIRTAETRTTSSGGCMQRCLGLLRCSRSRTRPAVLHGAVRTAALSTSGATC